MVDIPPSAAGQPDARTQRLQRLRRAIAENGAIHLKDAAQLLNVSEMTVRRDLATADAALVCLGGHVVNATAPSAVKYTIEQEIDQHTQDKRLACRAAAALLQAGDTVFIDCGTTMQSLAECLPDDLPLSVICYSMNVAAIMTQRPRTQVMLMGGLYHPSSQSFSSDEGLAYLRKLGINKAFISAGGVHAVRGASCSNFHETAIKQAAIATAVESILVVDASKLDSLKPAFFAELESFSRIIVGGAVPREHRKPFKHLPLEYATKTG
ncbi:putative transcriptional repressor for nucleotide catabolism (DeoR family) [Bradyrhizobium sp. STM 3843]|uniref:DeoR/GlpR family DNA-binding transcription regulator n=1 Tax=Bradyrhizobium sp. STM 3843 TaxID=551947 RepID=UPI000240AAA0|nr:DeoR family transcriptional regulator [Bradyrhizobium sp. STM 3843]CCE05469.1 putative transcriptional repressor for nucleotide catabolism (DeoR family) [Bradyrhizobium sp. STM 3843]